MQITLTARGIESGGELYRVQADDRGRWRYQSRAIEQAEGQLSRADLAQFQSFYDKVNWELEVLGGPTSAGDSILFEMAVTHSPQDRQLYQFTESMAHRSWQFRDLVHFLRHNVATGGNPATF